MYVCKPKIRWTLKHNVSTGFRQRWRKGGSLIVRPGLCLQHRFFSLLCVHHAEIPSPYSEAGVQEEFSLSRSAVAGSVCSGGVL